jgi:hypothetical protein
MDAAGPPNRVGRSAAEDLSGRVFWSEAGARSRCAGVPRAKSRGVAQRRGKNSAAMVSCGPAASIGPTPKQGFGPSDAPQRTSTCRIHCKRGGGLVQGAVPVGAPAFTAGSGRRKPDLDAETDCCLADTAQHGPAALRTGRSGQLAYGRGSSLVSIIGILETKVGERRQGDGKP